MNEKGWNINSKSLKNGLYRISKNTGLRGRWEELGKNPKIICDTAHNIEGIKWISNQLSEESYENLHLVIGMVNDKDPEIILKKFPKKAQYYFCESSIPRRLPLEKLVDASKNAGITSSGNFRLVKDAYNFALSNAKKEDLIFIGGSTFVVADLLNFLGNQ